MDVEAAQRHNRHCAQPSEEQEVLAGFTSPWFTGSRARHQRAGVFLEGGGCFVVFFGVE